MLTISPGVQMFSADSVEFKGLRSAYNLASQRQPTPDEESNDTTAHGSLLTSPKHFLGTERPPGLKPEAANRIFASSSSSFPSSPPRTSRSPSPIIEFFAGVPSEGYLQSSLQPSLLCPVSTTNPKLLILDLNGTLVYRSPRNRRQNRVITPRPYMEPFTRYVTHEGSGLQTMIWSSAQPVNVEKMARACFGEEGVKNLKAIWARDTLGLSQRDYGRKVQTVKDLNLVWKKLPFTALDTILLDDSRLKAHLQPYNHLILTEYDSDMSSRDRKILQRLYAASSSAVAGNVRQEEGELEESNARTLGDSEEPDQTLLAVIGILARGVRQTNVPGWMRAGGLWGSHSASISQSTSNLLFVKSADPSPSDIPLDDMNSDELNGQAVKRKRELSSDNEEGAIADQTIFQGIEDEPVKGPPRQSVQRLWFEDPEVFARWVAQGKAELERLNIPVLHGLRSSGAELENAQAGGIHQATLRV
ncbi:hypothetical protein FRB98_004687 [Tulasnella sp. 332]|nr:hypothetical protein FRB98_004687 [Tulasnella sp. 332]